MLFLEGNPERSASLFWSVCPNEGSLLLVERGITSGEDYNYLTPSGKRRSSLSKYQVVIAGIERSILLSCGRTLTATFQTWFWRSDETRRPGAADSAHQV